MPTLKLTNLATYRSYFQEIATLHKEIDGFKCGDEDVIRNDNRSDMPERFLWLQPYDRARYNDSFSDNITKAKVARLAYFIIADSEMFADEEAAFDFCESVIEQIVAKLLKDKRGEVVDGEYTMIATQVNNFAGGPVEKKLGSTKYIGWELEATFLDNANLQYDATKWESPEP